MASVDTGTGNQDQALAAIERDHRYWHTWAGVGGLLYARRLKSSPPRVVRAATPDGLRAEIEASEIKAAERGQL